jgi:hypothetical protein
VWCGFAASVQEACSTRLLQTWLKICEGNALDLLQCLDVENAVEACRCALKALFKTSSPKELVENFDLLNERSLCYVLDLVVLIRVLFVLNCSGNIKYFCFFACESGLVLPT